MLFHFFIAVVTFGLPALAVNVSIVCSFITEHTLCSSPVMPDLCPVMPSVFVVIDKRQVGPIVVAYNGIGLANI